MLQSVVASCEVWDVLTLSCCSLSLSAPLSLRFFPEMNDLDAVSASRQRIEDKLVEEYRNCAYYRRTKEELGESNWTTLASSVGLNLIVKFNWVDACAALQKGSSGAEIRRPPPAPGPSPTTPASSRSSAGFSRERSATSCWTLRHQWLRWETSLFPLEAKCFCHHDLIP